MPLAVLAGYAAAGAIGLAQILGPQYYAWKKYTTPSANADWGTLGYYAWQAHLTRQMQQRNTHMSAHDAIYGGLAINIARIHAQRALSLPNFGINSLGLPGANGDWSRFGSPSFVRMSAWNPAQMAAAALALHNGAGGGSREFDTYSRDMIDALHNAAQALHKPIPPQEVDVTLRLPTGMAIGDAKLIVGRSENAQQPRERSRGTIPTSPRAPSPFSTLEQEHLLPTH